MEPRMSLIKVDAQCVLGYKALPYPLTSLPTSNNSNWSALYPQLTFQQAISYLPNQWERKNKQAQIVYLSTVQPLNIIVYNDPTFTQGNVDKDIKADQLKTCYATFQTRNEVLKPLPTSMPLMDAFGSIQVAVCALDASLSSFELILPHSLTTPEWITISPPICVMEESEFWPCTLGRIVSHEGNFTKAQLKDEAIWLPKLIDLLQLPDDQRFKHAIESCML
ncbi:hypothetical protein THRCLA_05016 [Thraustotheca clavata]|uniref:Uncharacterized protein n=1 Tax=Thraustotheca clavata TaxID=74557 RepID=A0A1V9ZX83_9STRA|nr:hypothetical protein THRCLA_05016 [Thraustotheca clavata]